MVAALVEMVESGRTDRRRPFGNGRTCHCPPKLMKLMTFLTRDFRVVSVNIVNIRMAGDRQTAGSIGVNISFRDPADPC
jgi:hypothetical protein